MEQIEGRQQHVYSNGTDQRNLRGGQQVEKHLPLPFLDCRGGLFEGPKKRKSMSNSGLPLKVLDLIRELAHKTGLPLKPSRKMLFRWEPSLAMKVQKGAAFQAGATKTPVAPSEADFLMASAMRETGGDR